MLYAIGTNTTSLGCGSRGGGAQEEGGIGSGKGVKARVGDSKSRDAERSWAGSEMKVINAHMLNLSVQIPGQLFGAQHDWKDRSIGHSGGR